MGASNSRIIFRELLPNLTAPIIVYASILIPQVILYEAALSFLGVGVTDQPSWGQMISDATPIFATPGGTCSSPASRSCSPCSPSTSSATRCRTRSTRGEEALTTMKLTTRQTPTERNDDATKLRWLLALGRRRRFGADCVGVRQRRQQLAARAAARARDAAVRAPTAAPDGAKQGGDLTVHRGLRRRLHRPGRRLLPVHLHGDLGDAVDRSRHTRPTTSRADAAAGRAAAPTVSDDGKTITYKLRDDVMYSPAGQTARSATAADVKYAIERSLLPGVPNGYVQNYLSGVVGIPEAIKEAQANPTGGAPDISGITAPDDTTLVIKLNDTTSLGVIGALTLPVSAPVPRGVREAVRRREPVDLRRASGLDRPVHDRERRARASSPATRRTRRSTWFATRTGRRPTRTSGPRTWTTSPSRRASPTPSRPARRC